jgi:hypothetical protein
MEKPCMGWVFRVLEFCFFFFFFFLFLPSVAPAGKYSVWSVEVLQAHLELVARGPVGQWASRLAGR